MTTSPKAAGDGGRRTALLYAVTAGLLLIAAGPLAHHVTPQVKIPPAGLNRSQLDRLDEAASASLFGQFLDGGLFVAQSR